MDSQVDELARQCRQGDKQAFAGIYDTYIDKIYMYLFYRTFHRETSEDLTSRTFLKVMEKIHQYKPKKGRFSAWIFSIARNQLIDHFRTNRKTVDIYSTEEPAGKQDIEKDAIDREQVKQIRGLLQDLKPVQREIVLLRVWQDLPYSEIAEIIGKSEENCKMIFSRTLVTLRHDLLLAMVIIILFL